MIKGDKDLMAYILMHLSFKYEDVFLVYRALLNNEKASPESLMSIIQVEELLKQQGVTIYTIIKHEDIINKEAKDFEVILIKDKDGKILTIEETKTKYLMKYATEEQKSQAADKEKKYKILFKGKND